MCFSSDAPAPPPPVQEAKQPDFQAQRDARKKRTLTGGGTLLTSPSGITNAGETMAKPTLLGQ